MVSTFPESHVLEYFQCPFQDVDQLSCSYQVHFKTNGQFRSRCPFGHQSQSGNRLRELPTYVCFSYLTNGCRNAIYSNGAGDVIPTSPSPQQFRNGNTTSTNGDQNSLPRCTEGFHPAMEDLVDLEQLHQKMAFHILSGDNKLAKQKTLLSSKSVALVSPSAVDGLMDEEQQQQQKGGEAGGSSEMARTNSSKKVAEEMLCTTPLHADDQCCVCLESVREDQDGNLRLFGLTEGCNHVFCSDCLLTWCEGRVSVSNNNTHKCPTCRVETGKVLVAQRLPATAAEKAKLFEQQYKCLAICRHSITPSLLSSDDDDDDEDDDDDDDVHMRFGSDEDDEDDDGGALAANLTAAGQLLVFSRLISAHIRSRRGRPNRAERARGVRDSGEGIGEEGGGSVGAADESMPSVADSTAATNGSNSQDAEDEVEDEEDLSAELD